MSYTPTEWKAGDTVTSAKLNKIEQGVASAGGGAYFVDTTLDPEDGSYTLAKTAAEVLAAAQTSRVIAKEQGEDFVYLYTLTSAGLNDGEYVFTFGSYEYSAIAADEYPKTNGAK